MGATPAAAESRAMWSALLFGAALVFLCALLSLAPREGRQVAVFASPWSGPGSAMRVAAAARADIVGGGAADWVAVAADPGPAGIRRLYTAGAFFVADAAFFRACALISETETDKS